jgi:hypothetical protein
VFPPLKSPFHTGVSPEQEAFVSQTLKDTTAAFAGVAEKRPMPIAKAADTAIDTVGSKDNFFISDSVFTLYELFTV